MNNRLTDTHRESIVAVLGAPPELCALEPEVLSVEDVDGYQRQRVSYCVSPGERIVSYVLVPHDNTKRFPALVCHHRHGGDWRIGKSEVVGLDGSPDEAIGVELVKRGYVVLAPDALAFEERRPHEDAGYENNFQQLALRLLRGETLLRKAIWDISRGIDFLETLPEVDEYKIGIIGHGYGALMAAWTAVLDERIVAAGGHRHWTSMHELLRQRRDIQIEFAVPRLLQVADYDWILGMIAPRPFLISTLVDDASSLDAEMIFQRAQQIYERLDVPGNITFQQHQNSTHECEFPPEAREQVYAWLDDWLMPPDRSLPPG